MVVSIGDVSVSIPVGIDKWAHESEDNMTEFNGMIESMMYAVNKTMKERYSPGPYQKLYNKQMEELKSTGMSTDDANKFLEKMVDTTLSDTKTTEETVDTFLRTLLGLSK